MDDMILSMARSVKKSTHKAIQKFLVRPLTKQKHESAEVDTKENISIIHPNIVQNTPPIEQPGEVSCSRSDLEKKDIFAALPVYFPEESTVVIYQDDGTVCMSQNYPDTSRKSASGTSTSGASRSELEKIRDTVCLEDRDEAIREGLSFMGKRFEIFQFHPPLVYGRTAGVPPKESVGIVVVKHTVPGQGGHVLLDGGAGVPRYCYLVVTYMLPETSAHILCQARLFCSKFL